MLKHASWWGRGGDACYVAPDPGFNMEGGSMEGGRELEKGMQLCFGDGMKQKKSLP